MRLADFDSKKLPEEQVRHHVAVFKGLEEGDREESLMAILAHLGGMLGLHIRRMPKDEHEDTLGYMVEKVLVALEKFDLGAQVKLSTYVHYYLLAGYQVAREQSTTVRVPSSARSEGARAPEVESLGVVREGLPERDVADGVDVAGEVVADEGLNQRLEGLSDWQREVAVLLSQGHSQKQAAWKLGLTESHVNRLVRGMREMWS